MIMSEHTSERLDANSITKQANHKIPTIIILITQFLVSLGKHFGCGEYAIICSASVGSLSHHEPFPSRYPAGEVDHLLIFRPIFLLLILRISFLPLRACQKFWNPDGSLSVSEILIEWFYCATRSLQKPKCPTN